MKRSICMLAAVCSIVLIGLVLRLHAADEPGASAPALTVVEATYGLDQTWIDVTAGVAKHVKDERLILSVENSYFTDKDPAFGRRKTLKVKYKIGQEAGEAVAQEGELIAIVAPVKVDADPKQLVILEAKYGAKDVWVDVKPAVKRAELRGVVRMKVDGGLTDGKDPLVGVTKQVYVVYAWKGVQYVTQQKDYLDLVISPNAKPAATTTTEAKPDPEKPTETKPPRPKGKAPPLPGESKSVGKDSPPPKTYRHAKYREMAKLVAAPADQQARLEAALTVFDTETAAWDKANAARLQALNAALQAAAGDRIRTAKGELDLRQYDTERDAAIEKAEAKVRAVFTPQQLRRGTVLQAVNNFESSVKTEGGQLSVAQRQKAEAIATKAFANITPQTPESEKRQAESALWSTLREQVLTKEQRDQMRSKSLKSGLKSAF